LSNFTPSVVVVSAPSGAGKSTVLQRVLRETRGLRFSVSHTTRPPREGEQDGREYHFVTEAVFEEHRAAGGFLEWAEVYGHRYGTSRAELLRAETEGNDLVLDVDVQGALQVRRKLDDAVSLFILPPSREELERRLRGRGKDDPHAIARRLLAARDEIALYYTYDYVLVNDDLDRSVSDVKSIISAARRRTSRMRDQARSVLRTFESHHSQEEKPA
jgi:guanylate kinase